MAVIPPMLLLLPIVELLFIEGVVAAVLVFNDPGILEEELMTLLADNELLVGGKVEVVIGVAGYVPIPGTDIVLPDGTTVLVPRIIELRLLNKPPVEDGDATG
ncbi:hypothetical protein F4680DRAFT_408829 [Xylaria scruposa]|nr:hypothetical protein F4680DRAFT_408829 [Xylaria scruposa]